MTDNGTTIEHQENCDTAVNGQEIQEDQSNEKHTKYKTDKKLFSKSPIERKIKNPLKAFKRVSISDSEQRDVTANNGEGAKSSYKQKENRKLGFNKSKPKTTSATSLARGDVRIKRKSEGFFTKLHVESLPQVFPVRYLGFIPCSGLYGMEQVKQPLKLLLQNYIDEKRSVDLAYNSACLRACPRIKIEVASDKITTTPVSDSSDNESLSSDVSSSADKGDTQSIGDSTASIATTTSTSSSTTPSDCITSNSASVNGVNGNNNNDCKPSTSADAVAEESAALSEAFRAGQVPLQLISFASQSSDHQCVFVIVQVIQVSRKGHKSKCHAYACHNKEQCKLMALAMALAFKHYARQLEGKDKPFQVELESEETTPNGEEQSEKVEGATNTSKDEKSLVDEVLQSVEEQA